MKRLGLLIASLFIAAPLGLLFVPSGQQNAVASSPPAPVVQDTGVVVPPQGQPVEPTEAEAADLQAIAEAEGISSEEAIARYSWQLVFGEAVAALHAAYPDRYVGSGMNEDGVVGGVVRFSGTVPEDVARYLTDVPVPVRMITEDTFTEDEVRVAVSAAHFASREFNPSNEVSTEFNEANDKVSVVVYRDVQKSSASRGVLIDNAATTAARRAIRDATGSSEAPEVEVTYAPESGQGTDTIRGGAILTLPGSTGLVCTSGWSVRSTSGGRGGLVTADHCPSNMNYSNRNVLTDSRTLPNNGGDIKFLRSSETVGETYYYGVGKYRNVTGKSTPSDDQRLCKFGRKTGLTCDKVRDRFTCRNSYCNLVSMDNRKAGGGDSGGPWGYGGTAYGVHSGYHTSFFQKRDQWTPLYNTLGNLDVQLKTAN